ncbi:MAG: RNA-directed DNA polymerase [Chromatiales bacterium]|nr:RNA-directed DNA polymerase [Chromatiales bacterium]
MRLSQLSPRYARRRIQRVESLAKLLGTSPTDLAALAANSAHYWIPGRTKTKSDGTKRHTSNALEPLKSIHKAIKNKILRATSYPHYLMGGLPSDEEAGCIRHCEENAKRHSGQRIVVTEDIKSFYPSITASRIHDIWQGFYRFSPEVAELLTKLTTYRGVVPQGWVPSSYLANLALWDCEPGLVAHLERQGLTYTRWIDDITISSKTFVAPACKTAIVTAVYGMLRSANFSPARTKHRIRTRGQNQRVMNLNVSGKRPTVPRQRLAELRATVRNLLRDAGSLSAADYTSKRDRIEGQIGSISRMHPRLAERLRNQLASVRRPAN